MNSEKMAAKIAALVETDGMDIEDWLIHGQSGWESLTPAQLAAEYDEERTWRKEE
jgi:hypothetical protein